jgi:hypothetical protein
MINLINCRNQMSRDLALKRSESESTLHGLVHYFDLMYEPPPNNCFFHRPDGTLDFFVQEDGFPQGVPLSPALACLVIFQTLEPIIRLSVLTLSTVESTISPAMMAVASKALLTPILMTLLPSFPMKASHLQ